MATTVEPKQSEWKPTRHELMIMATLSGLSLMVSLDASIIVTSLNVGFPFICLLLGRRLMVE